MLFDTAAWAVILVVAVTAGRGVLALLGVNGLRAGDRFILTSWIGVVTVSLVLLVLSLATPLTPAAGGTAALVLLALGVWLGRSADPDRRPAAAGQAPERLGVVVGSGVLVIGVAALASDAVTLYDSLVYHVGIMRWLREHGTVPGVALIHNRLGHVSAWFTLAAPFDSGAGVNRAAGIPVGMALLLVGAQAAIACGRVVARRATVADWFLLIASAALLWAGTVGGSSTPSPDVAANALIVVVAWSLLVLAEGSRSLGRHVSGAARHTFVPLILALGASAMKLFAVPALVVAAAHAVLAGRGRGAPAVGRAATATGLIVAVLAPLFAANLVATGCLLYPSPVGCVDAPWSVGASEAAAYTDYIRDVARWERRGGPTPDAPLAWVLPWVAAHPVLTLLALVAPLLAFPMLRTGASRSPATGGAPEISDAVRAVVAVALLGVTFTAWQAPAPRFLFAFVLIVPSLAMARWLAHWWDVRAHPRDADRSARFGAGFSAAAILIGFACALTSQKLNVLSALVSGAPLLPVRASDLVFPRAPEPPGRLYRWRVNDIDVVTPVPTPVADTLGYQSAIAHDAAFEKCSTAPLPCTPYLPGRDVRLRAPALGVGAGFRRDAGAHLAGRAATCIGEWTSDVPLTAALSSISATPPDRDTSRCRPAVTR